MRLIDADELIKKLNKTVAEEDLLVDQFNADFIEKFIDNEPTAYDVEKVVEQLEELMGTGKFIDEAIEIVKVGGRNENKRI